MILKSYQISSLNDVKSNFLLFYGENEGFKNEDIESILNSGFTNNIYRYEESEVFNNTMREHALYMFATPPEDRPKMLDTFNSATALGVIVQLFLYRKHLYKVIYPDGNPTSLAFLAGFILVGILTSWCISQIYVILNFLKVDG